jgi:ABC-type multidrug transport system ATPase subunit
MAMTRLEENASLVPWAALPVRVGRAPDADLRLTEPTVSRQHAVLEVREGRLYVRDLDSRYGTFVNGVQVRERPLSPNDLLRFGRAVTYCVEVGGLRRRGRRGMRVCLEDLQIGTGKRVLVDLAGQLICVPAGQFVGLLGPSGAGKTMVLRAIGGIRQPLRGRVATDVAADIWADIEAHRRRVAFVPQEDVVYPLLTVRESLALALALHAPPETEQTPDGRIAAALELLRLTPHADKRVGVLSGGQRKRVSVALEWMRQPELLILDEPTAGLDPSNEAHLMEHLVQVSRQGITVLCSTHLMENIRLLDLVLVLGIQNGRGTLAFRGPPEELLPAMGCRDFADVYEKLAHGDFPCHGCEPRTAEPVTGAQVPVQADPDGSLERPTPSSGPVRPWSQPVRRVPLPPSEGVALHVLGAIARRSWLLLWRDAWARGMVLGQPVILAMVVCLTQFNPGRLNGLLFFTTVVACWLGMNNAVRDLVRERRNYIRERMAGLSPTSYLMAKWLVFAVLGAGQLIVFLLLVRIGAGRILPENLASDLTRIPWGVWLLCLWAVYLGGLGLAWIISVTMRSEEAAVAWLPILILPQILLSEVGTGVASLSYSDARPFRPLAVTLWYPTCQIAPDAGQTHPADALPATAVVADVLSMGVFSRPALVLLKQLLPDAPAIAGFGDHFWLADLCHLALLLLITYAAFWAAFAHQEPYWPVLIGY